MNILLTCAGGSSTIYLARKLKKNSNVFLVDSSDKTIGPHLGFPFKVVPFGNSREYLPAIKKLVKKWKIDCIAPGADEELLPLKKNFANTKVIVVAPSAEFIETCINKKRLMDTLESLDISCLSYYKNIKDIRYPAIVKPIFGRGSREVHKLDNEKQLRGYFSLYQKNFFDVLVQDFIQGEEYTISVVVNNLNKLIGIVPKKIILKRGITRVAVAKKHRLIEAVCKKIVDKMNPQGLFNVQLVIEKGKVYIFEINPRLSTTSVLTERVFGNEIDIFIKNYNQSAITKLLTIEPNIKLYRYEENVFVK